MNQIIDHLREVRWLHRIRKGDGAAFTEVYRDYAPRIWRHAYYRTSSRETADDIMGETFLKAWEFIRLRADEVIHLRAFLYRIANNLVIDHYRARAHAAVRMEEDLERTLGYDARLAELVDERTRSEQLRRALGRLPTESRDLLVMRFLDELPVGEIAETLGKNRDATYVSIHRAVKKLKEICSTAK